MITQTQTLTSRHAPGATRTRMTALLAAVGLVLALAAAAPRPASAGSAAASCPTGDYAVAALVLYDLTALRDGFTPEDIEDLQEFYTDEFSFTPDEETALADLVYYFSEAVRGALTDGPLAALPDVIELSSWTNDNDWEWFGRFVYFCSESLTPAFPDDASRAVESLGTVGVQIDSLTYFDGPQAITCEATYVSPFGVFEPDNPFGFNGPALGWRQTDGSFTPSGGSPSDESSAQGEAILVAVAQDLQYAGACTWDGPYVEDDSDDDTNGDDGDDGNDGNDGNDTNGDDGNGSTNGTGTGTGGTSGASWIPTGGGAPQVAPGSGVLQHANGSTTPLSVTSPGVGQVRYSANGITVTLTGTTGTSSMNGLVASQSGEIVCEVCTALAAGSTVEAWLFSEPRLVAAHRTDGEDCQRFTIPLGAPLDGGGPVPAGAHTLQLALPTSGGMQAVNIGVTVGGPVPASVPAGDGEGRTAALWLLGALSGAVLIARSTRRATPAVG